MGDSFIQEIDRLKSRDGFRSIEEEVGFILNKSISLDDKDLKRLAVMRDFYEPIGGIKGYQIRSLNTMIATKNQNKKDLFVKSNPIDLEKLPGSIVEGLNMLQNTAEILVAGGSADRLQYVEDGVTYPAFMLNLLGHSLLEWYLREVYSREYLLFKLFGLSKKRTIIILSSEDKDNIHHMKNLLKKNNYFGRNPDDLFLLNQSLVPLFNREGKWCFNDGHLIMKPGGHGSIWRAMEMEGLYDHLINKGYVDLLVRQINNPMAGMDDYLLRFLSMGGEGRIGLYGTDHFNGYNEGINITKKLSNGERILTNVEYCDPQYLVAKKAEGSTSNVNILLVPLKEVKELVLKNPLPGCLINFKLCGIGRLESSMQSISESTTNSFLVKSKRSKSISVLKKLEGEKESMDSCIEDLYKTRVELFKECGGSVGDGVRISYHPALGPGFRVIREKIKRCSLLDNSEIFLEIADAYLDNVEVRTMLWVETREVMGHFLDGELCFSNSSAKCFMKNVSVNVLIVKLHEGSEIWISDSKIDARETLEVPAGFIMTIRRGKKELKKNRGQQRKFCNYSHSNGQIKVDLIKKEVPFNS